MVCPTTLKPYDPQAVMETRRELAIRHHERFPAPPLRPYRGRVASDARARRTPPPTRGGGSAHRPSRRAWVPDHPRTAAVFTASRGPRTPLAFLARAEGGERGRRAHGLANAGGDCGIPRCGPVRVPASGA